MMFWNYCKHTRWLKPRARVVNYDETPSGQLEVKIHSDLPKYHQLQVWIHTEPESLDYAYQLYTTVPLLRWDNTPHYEHLSTAPHHFHDKYGKARFMNPR
jgi:hypothetical protein